MLWSYFYLHIVKEEWWESKSPYTLW